MRVDANFYGGVPMPDAGYGGPAPVDRRYGRDDFVACYDNLTHWARTMDRLGYDTMWLTEHHFQYEGYEVTPNLILFGLHLAKETKRLRLGQMFNVVPQWHPLRLAEDAAMMQILTGDRMQFGVGRGTVPREAQSLGGVVASGDNEMSAELDRINRELFEESMEIIRSAWTQERFSFSGKHFTLPPPGIPDRGSTVQDLTLIPKPIAPIDIWQAVTSPPTLEYCARVRQPPFDHRPPLEDTIDQRMMAIGSVDEVVDTLGTYVETLDCEHLVLFFDMPGLTRDQMDEQLEMTAAEVLPRLTGARGSAA